MKINSSITAVKKSTQINKIIQHSQHNAFDNRRQHSIENDASDEPKSFISVMGSSIAVDLSNDDSFDNNMSSKCPANLNQSQHQPKRTGVGQQENDPISINNIELDDELILPCHIQLELKSNTK